MKTQTPQPSKLPGSTIPRTPVKSSSIAGIGYDAATRTLAVEFASGGVHHYPDVSPEQHGAFIKAESIGKHFHANIRSRSSERRA